MLYYLILCEKSFEEASLIVVFEYIVFSLNCIK